MDLYHLCRMMGRFRATLFFRMSTIVLAFPYLIFILWFTGFWEVPHEQMLREAPQLPPKTDDVTLVTAYINIGKFNKGENGVKYSPDKYHKWIQIFGRIENPLVVFVEDKKYYDMFQTVRKEFPANLTKVVQISRNQTWAFSLRPEIERLFKQPYYPEIHPNTVNPDYSCIMHAKYEFVGRVVDENPFNTRYYAWLDVGLFRKISQYGTKKFRIKLPPKFRFDKVAFTEVHHLQKVKQSAKAIVQRNVVSTSGSFFIGRGDVMKTWVQHYKNVTETMIRIGWISSDEQVVYFMRQHHKEFQAHTNIQTYKHDGMVYGGYHLGYISSTVDACEYNYTCTS